MLGIKAKEIMKANDGIQVKCVGHSKQLFYKWNNIW